MARRIGDSGQAVVLDAAQIKRLLKIAGTTQHPARDQTVITLSYWLGSRGVTYDLIGLRNPHKLTS